MGCGKTWTREELDWLINNYEKLGRMEVLKQHNIQFPDTPRTLCSMDKKAYLFKLNSSADICKSNRTKACKRKSHDIGTIAEHSTGFGTKLKIKVAPGKWVGYSRYFWENNIGPLPKNYSIFFIDGDNKKVSINNMVAMPKRCIGELVNRGWITKNRTFNLTVITWCELKAALRNDYRCIFGGDRIAKNNKKT